MKSKPLVIAHRGYSGKFPENTLAAFHAAVKAGAEMIELDVHLTKDGALLVTHDFELGRTCNGKGKLSDHSSRELRAFDAGSWFNPKFKNERFPVLGEVLALAKGKIQVNIEIKEETLTSDSAFQTMAEKVLVLINGHGMSDQVVISSFEWKVLERLREKDPKVKLGVLNHGPEKGLGWERMVKIRPFSYHPNFRTLTEAHVSDIHARGLKIFSYTANGDDEFQKLLSLGADGIITNEVESLLDFLHRK